MHKICILTNFGKYFSLFSLKYEKSYPLGAKVYSCVYPLYKISRHVWLIRHETCLMNYAWMCGNHIFTQLSICHKMSMANYPKRCTILTTRNVTNNYFWLRLNILFYLLILNVYDEFTRFLFSKPFELWLWLKVNIHLYSYPNMSNPIFSWWLARHSTRLGNTYPSNMFLLKIYQCTPFPW